MLYKNRYLICLIDIKTDNIVSVYDNAIQLSEAYNIDGRSMLSKAFKNDYVFKNKYKIEFIDCYEKHNDIFDEEDKKFIEFIEDNNSPRKKICKLFNISERTYYRHLKNSNFKAKVLREYSSWL